MDDQSLTVSDSKADADARTPSTGEPDVESPEKVSTSEESDVKKTESCDLENRSPERIADDEESRADVENDKNCDKNSNRNIGEFESVEKVETDKDEQPEKTYPSATLDGEQEAPKEMKENSTLTKNEIPDSETSSGQASAVENAGNEAEESQDGEKSRSFSKVAENWFSGAEESKEILVDRSVAGEEATKKNSTSSEAPEFVELTKKPQGSLPEVSESLGLGESIERGNEANGVEYAELKSAIEVEKVSSVVEKSKDLNLDEEESMNKEKRAKETCDIEETLKNGETLSEVEKTSDSRCSRIPAAPESPLKQRSVIEDIFDDWQDDNVDEDQQQKLSKSHDSVEMELKILLHDEKSTDGICPAKNEARSSENPEEKASSPEAKEGASSKREMVKQSLEESSRIEEKTEERIEPRKCEKTSDVPIARERLMKQKPLAPRPGVKVPGILLTSPIVSKSAVSKVLKERIREQQKEFDSPTKPDLFFVKKITQRLSHKLAAASAASVPGLLPIPQISKSPSTTTNETKKTASNVDKELLAILEGDVDPDWSNLKVPSSVVDEAKSLGDRNSSTKLDRASIEREIALKQLLELPSNASKKIVAKKTPTKARSSKIVNSTKTNETTTQKKEKNCEEDAASTNLESALKEDSMDSNQSQEYKSDETRSGRKRKPTEKAREHENSTKRMKVLKPKSPSNKRKILEDESSVGEDSRLHKEEEMEESISDKLEESAKKRIDEAARLDDYSADSHSEESSSELVEKKVTLKPNSKRKLPGQTARQKMTVVKKSPPGKLSKKTGTKMSNAKGQKQRNGETSQPEAKPKKKTINEIDRLLQDEGVVNLLYDVEHADKKRLVPITKSQTKVMDLQKIQRELKIRTKLVRNAVLRLRTSNIPTNKVSPRSKRTVCHSIDFYSEKKTSDSKIPSPTSPTDFIYPAKIRNAADASIIIRRHSSSSFSSASASPRASIDAPERLSIDASKNDDTSLAASHATRSNKRRLSHEDLKKKKKTKQSPEPKRNRRKTIDRSDSEAKIEEEETLTVFNAPTKNNKTSASLNFNLTPVKTKKIEPKKNQKSPKQLEPIDIDENSSGSSGKITTRSNPSASTLAGKVTPKNKKPAKCKVSFAKGNESVSKKIDSPGQQDELSACLAEAVTALSNDSGGASRTRSNIPVNRNKTKGNPSTVAKSLNFDEKLLKTEPKVQFSNSEILVQRHGKLVQLLLTPSTSKKIRNGITLQVMQEIRENLSILKKDEECRVVLLTSTGTSFCEGLELSTLLHDNKDERRLRAEELANAVKEFIKSLATFNKPIVAGVQGTAIGLGVTMLPWFDLVIASDKATFSTPYGKLGQIAEGAAIFTLSHILGSSVTSELLLGGRTLTANEALRAGLVTRVLWPDRFKDELLPSLRAMSEQSSQSMEATKALLRHSLRKKLDAALESESYLLIQHWCSAECQAAITAYVDEKIQ